MSSFAVAEKFKKSYLSRLEAFIIGSKYIFEYISSHLRLVLSALIFIIPMSILAGIPSENQYVESGRNLLNNQEYSRAIGYLGQAIQMNPGDARPYLLIAQIYTNQDKYDLASEYLQKAANNGADRVAVLKLEVTVSIDQNQISTAISDLNDILKLTSGEEYLHYAHQLGILYENERAYSQARELFSSLPTNDTVAAFHLGLLAVNQSDLNSAKSYFNKAFQTTDETLSSHVSRYLQIINSNKDQESITGGLASLLVGDGYYTLAETPLEQLVLQFPDYATGYAYLGLNYLGESRISDAQQEASTALTLDPQNSLANYDLGIAALETKSWQDAQNYFSEAIKVDHCNAADWEGLGNTYLAEHFYADTEIAYQQAATCDTTDVGYILLLPEFYVDHGLHMSDNVALSAASKAVSELNNNAEAYIILGRVELFNNNLADAFDSFEKAIAINPDSAEAHLYLGEDEARNGYSDFAAVELQKAIDLDTTQVIADKAQKQLNLLNTGNLS